MLRKLFRVVPAAIALAVAAPFAALAQTAPPALPELTQPTAADFGALPILSNPTISPDGKRVVARGVVGGETKVLLIDISQAENKGHAIGMPKGHQLEWIRWAGSNRVLVSLSKMEHVMGDEVRLTRLICLDVVTGKQMFVGPVEQGIDGDDVIHIDREGAFLLLSTQKSIFEYPSVYRVDLATGKSKLIVRAEPLVWNWYADSKGVVRAGMGVNGAKWWLIYREREDQAFARTVVRGANSDNETDIDQLFPIAGSDQGYAVATTRRGRFGLFRYDFRADKLGELVYEHPVVDIDDFTMGEDDALIGIFYTDERAGVHWLDPTLKRQQERIDRVLPGMLNQIVSVSDDKMRMLVRTGSATHPGSYLLLDRTTNKMALFAEPYEAMRNKRLSEMQPVRYKARDGLEIRAYLTLPTGKTDKNLPLVVMPHGGPFARDEYGYDNWVQYLASRGYVVLQPQFRGSTGFGRAFVEKGTGQWGRGMQDDVDDGVKWLAAQGTIDPRRVCIMGGSYGGYAAMWAAVRNPELYRCAISFAGVSDVTSQLRYSRKSFIASRYFSDWRDRIRGDKTFELDQISPLRQASRMTVPILIAHGTEDDRVPVGQSRRVHEALLKLGRDHEYVEYKGEGHGFEKPENATDFLNRVGAFLDRHNPAQ